MNLLPTLTRIYLNFPSRFVLKYIRVVSRIFLLVVQCSHGVFLNPLVVVFLVVLNIVFLLVVWVIPTYDFFKSSIVYLCMSLCLVHCKFESSNPSSKTVAVFFFFSFVKNTKSSNPSSTNCCWFFFCCEREIFESFVANCCIVVKKRYTVK